MKGYCFSNGKFEEHIFPDSQNDLVEEPEDFLKRMNFLSDSSTQLGTDYSSMNVKVYRSGDYDDKYIVHITIACTIETIFVPSFPDLIQLMAQLNPLVQASYYWDEEINKELNREYSLNKIDT